MYLPDNTGGISNSIKKIDSIKNGRNKAMKLIIQSDDLGITEAVSCGIARAAREGAITCTGLFSNMPAAPFAVELMQQYPEICQQLPYLVQILVSTRQP